MRNKVNCAPTKRGPAYRSIFDDFFTEPFFKDFPPAMRKFHMDVKVNVSEEQDHFEIEVAAPGFEKSDFSLSVEKDILTIKGEKSHEGEEKKKNYTRREFGHETFSRSFRLPENVDAEKISAKYDQGVLTVMLVKHEEEKTKTVDIEVS